MSNERFANYVLFERLSNSAFGDRYRAGILRQRTVVDHALLQMFNGASLEREPFWNLISDRRPLATSLADPHLGHCIEFDRSNEIPFLAYEFCSGKPLNQLLTAVRNHRLQVPLDQSLFMVERAALGLTAAYDVHHRGRPVLHGFLVPDFVYLSGDGEIRVLGIEIAPGLRRPLADHPAFAPYLAPEVRAGAPPAETDDVYSLGALLYHLLCGQPLPSRTETSASEAIGNARMSPRKDPLPPVIANLLKNSLAAPENRIPNTVIWQQVLSKIILDGEHNPTTFNLSFLMHTAFRQELEAEVEALAREQGQRPALEQESEPAFEEDREGTASRPPAGTLASAATGMRNRRPFLAGFALSFLGAALLLSAYFLLFRSQNAEAVEANGSPAGSSPESSISAPGSADPLQLGALPNEVSAFEEGPTATAPDEEYPLDEPADDPTESPEEVERLLVEQTENLEAIRAEYEQRLSELQVELDDARTADPVEETEIAPAVVQDTTDVELVPTALARTEAAGSPDEPAPLQDGASLEEPENRPGSSEPAATPIRQSQAVTAGSSSDSSPPAATPIQPASAEPVPESSRFPEDVSVVVVPPRLESPPRPSYPAPARRLRKAAKVTIRVLVGVDGEVIEAELSGPRAGLGFDSAALAAARRSRWFPGSRNGEPVEAWAQLTIDFRP